MTILEVDLCHQFKSGFELDIHFKIKNQITSIFGASGSGKTSIISMIAGLTKPNHGKVILNKRTLFDSYSHIDVPISQRKIGIIFQNHLLFPHLDVKSNLQYGIRRFSRHQSSTDLLRVCEVLEISHLLKRYPKHLSGGECQRVAIGRTLLSSPEALLMDEPLASLDDRLKDSILNYFDRILEEWQIPTIFISHNQSLVQRFSSHTIVVDHGKVLSSGLTADIIENHGPDIWKSAKGPINLLDIDSLEQDGESSYALICGQKIQLPSINQASNQKMYIQFSASDVVLSSNIIVNISTRNHLLGVVRRIVEQNSNILVAIDVGTIIWSKITMGAQKDLQLKIGCQIYCMIKTQSLEIVI